MKFWAHGFHSTLPSGWEDRSTLTLIGPTAPDGFATNIVVTRQAVPPGTNVTAFGETQVEALKSEIEDIQVLDERTTELKGRAIFQRMHVLRVGEQSVQQIQTYFVIEVAGQTEGIVITGSSSPEAFDAAVPAFKVFVEDFEPFDPCS